MIDHKFNKEDLSRYVKHEVHLEVSSKDMQPDKFERLDNAAACIGVSKQTFTYAHKHKRPKGHIINNWVERWS